MRRRFGGRLHARNDGIKPLFSLFARAGQLLPAGPDHGPEHSEFVDFFATYKSDAACDWSADGVPRTRDTAFPGV